MKKKKIHRASIHRTYWDDQQDRIEGLQALVDTWIISFHRGGRKDIVYVAKLQRRLHNLRLRNNSEERKKRSKRGRL